MSKRESISRYSLIIKKLRKKPASFAEVSDYLKLESELQDYNFNVSQRTFQRDLEDIRLLYNIDIQFDFSQKVYYIDSELEPEINERILEAFDTFNALNLSDRLSNHIHFEKRGPQGTENLYGLLHAIKNNFQTKFVYQAFWHDEPSKRQVEPYALKEFKNRWYILANDLKDGKTKTFALDRLSELEITKTHFEFPQGFNVNEHFRHCFGIVGPGKGKPEDIILSFEPFQGKYIKSLPLHQSQEILKDDKKELRVKLRLFITHDFYMELLSFGENLTVIKPKSLAKSIKATCEKMLGNYDL